MKKYKAKPEIKTDELIFEPVIMEYKKKNPAYINDRTTIYQTFL